MVASDEAVEGRGRVATGRVSVVVRVLPQNAGCDETQRHPPSQATTIQRGLRQRHEGHTGEGGLKGGRGGTGGERVVDPAGGRVGVRRRIQHELRMHPRKTTRRTRGRWGRMPWGEAVGVHVAATQRKPPPAPRGEWAATTTGHRSLGRSTGVGGTRWEEDQPR